MVLRARDATLGRCLMVNSVISESNLMNSSTMTTECLLSCRPCRMLPTFLEVSLDLATDWPFPLELITGLITQGSPTFDVTA